MGAWGAGTFDNDTACDWANQLGRSNDLALVKSAIAAVLNSREEYLDSDSGSVGLAACEVIARLKGNWGVQNVYTRTVDDWVTAHPFKLDQDLIARADEAIDHILAGGSELAELWNGNEEWRTAVEHLRRRVLA
jgi:uncharacterized protein DUF4259